MTHETSQRLRKAIDAALEEGMELSELQGIAAEVEREFEADERYFAKLRVEAAMLEAVSECTSALDLQAVCRDRSEALVASWAV